ncbi:MAG: cupin domain-containing protein [Bacteroidota bacterium]
MLRTFFLAVTIVYITADAYAQNSVDKEAIYSLIDQYAQAREKQDTVLLKQILTDEIDQLVSSGEWRRGIDKAKEGMMRSSRRNPGDRTLAVEHVRFITNESAIADARYEIRNADGEVVRKMWSTFMVVYQEDTWKISAIRNMLPAKPNTNHLNRTSLLPEAQQWIDRLQMQPHPEGGFYKETYKSSDSIPEIDRSYSTGIYYLLLENAFSAFHRIKSDEMWHFYAGETLEVAVLYPDGSLKVHRLGPNWKQGDRFQLVVPANHWFASRMADSTSYALVGCTVAPGFDFRDFEMANREKLLDEFPQHEIIIQQLTR